MVKPSNSIRPIRDCPCPTSGAGFTLIELLVVLAIVAVLLTLAVPKYFKQVEASKETVLRENLKQTREVIDRFFGDTGRYPNSLQELVDRSYLRDLPMDPVTASATSWALDRPPDGYKGEVFNLHSASSAIGKNGQAYAQW